MNIKIDDFIKKIEKKSFFYTNNKQYIRFSIASIEENFIGNNNFDENMSCKLSKNGDLISKMYIKIVLPKLQILNNKDNTLILLDLNNNLQILENDYINSKIFYKLIYLGIIELEKLLLLTFNLNNIIIKLNSILILDNKTSYDNIKSSLLYINKLYNFDIYSFILSNNFNNLINLNNIPLTINNIKNYINNLKYLMKIDNLYYLDNILDYNKKINYYNNKYINIKWIDNIGHYIINNYTLNINGIDIITYDNDYLNIYHDINKNINNENIYNNMINGDILYIPLLFWFNNNYAQSLPCVSLKNADIILNIKLNSLEKCIISDEINNINLNNIKILNMSLYVDYIYLNNEERINFSNNIFDYIIEQPLINYQKMKLKMEYSIKLDFNTNVKQLFWIIKNNYNLDIFKKYNNYDINIIYKINNISSSQIIINNITFNTININIGNHIFNINDNIKISDTIYYNNIYKIVNITSNSIIIISKYYIDETGYISIYNLYNNNPINKSFLKINNNNITANNNNIYYNIIQPYYYLDSDIKDGINIYNFNLYPNSIQPSGFYNFYENIDKTLDIELNSLFYNYCNKRNDDIIIKIYCIGYKIIRFSNGIMQIII